MGFVKDFFGGDHRDSLLTYRFGNRVQRPERDHQVGLHFGRESMRSGGGSTSRLQVHLGLLKSALLQSGFDNILKFAVIDRQKQVDGVGAGRQSCQVLVQSESSAMVDGDDFVDSIRKDKSSVCYGYLGFTERDKFSLNIG